VIKNAVIMKKSVKMKSSEINFIDIFVYMYKRPHTVIHGGEQVLMNLMGEAEP
jgi:hypothetical protein